MLYIFDLDGTLRVTKSGRPCPNTPDDQELLPGVREKIIALSDAGHRVTAATNQGGVSFGFMSVEDSVKINDATNSLLDWRIDRIEVSYYHSKGKFCDQHQDRSKPKPNMLIALAAWAKARPRDILFVGDAFTDQRAARNAGVKFQWAHEFFGWLPGFVTETDFGFSPVEWLKKWERQKNSRLRSGS